MLRISALVMIAAGIATLVFGPTVDGAGNVLAGTGIVLIVSGIGMLALDRLLAPTVRSSQDMARARGMRINPLTGAPTLRSGMEVASRSMAAAQQQMSNLMGSSAIQRSGVPGRATVKLARDTGERRNLNPVYEVDLVVSPEDGRAYDATVQTEVNSLAIAQCVPGTEVPVKIDPTDPQSVWVDWLAVAGGAAPGNPA